jgi:hydrogenase expression/formation protein HypC
MRVLRVDGIAAHATEGPGAPETLVDLSLTGPVAPGTWVLTHLGAAREVLDPDTAAQIAEAVEALRAVMGGAHDLGSAFADLDREPSLPPHLEAARAAGRATG